MNITQVILIDSGGEIHILRQNQIQQVLELLELFPSHDRVVIGLVVIAYLQSD